MTSSIQQRIDLIHKVGSTLSDGLAVYDILKELDERILQLSREALNAKSDRLSVSKESALLKKIKVEVLSHKDLSRKYSCVERWIQGGYDRSFILSDPEGVTFFGETYFRSIKVFKNARSQLSDENIDLDFDREQGKILFKVQGQWKSYSEIRDQIKYDPDDKKFIGWTFVHPDGFIPVDSTEWTTLRPFAQLSEHSHAVLKQVANKFWTSVQHEIDPGVDKPCVLQVVVLNKNFDQPCSALLKNAKKMGDHHCQIRLVDSEGRVYSFGLWGSKKDLDFVFTKKFPRLTFHTANALLSFPDREELNKLHADTVSIPLSLERFVKIKKIAEHINKNGGIRFCMTNRNCCRFAQEILQLGGVSVDPRITLSQALVACLPDAADIPYFGRAAHGLSHVISSGYSKIQSCLSFVPSPMIRLCAQAGKAVWFIPKMALRSLNSALFLCMGGGRGNESKVKGENVDSSESDDVHQLRLINSFWDIFKEKTTVIYHSHILRTWIQKQGSYQFFDNQVPQFNMVKM